MAHHVNGVLVLILICNTEPFVMGSVALTFHVPAEILQRQMDQPFRTMSALAFEVAEQF